MNICDSVQNRILDTVVRNTRHQYAWWSL